MNPFAREPWASWGAPLSEGPLRALLCLSVNGGSAGKQWVWLQGERSRKAPGSQSPLCIPPVPPPSIVTCDVPKGSSLLPGSPTVLGAQWVLGRGSPRRWRGCCSRISISPRPESVMASAGGPWPLGHTLPVSLVEEQGLRVQILPLFFLDVCPGQENSLPEGSVSSMESEGSGTEFLTLPGWLHKRMTSV